eukprot:9169729-Alexandrium_andersonii.AAC.1
MATTTRGSSAAAASASSGMPAGGCIARAHYRLICDHGQSQDPPSFSPEATAFGEIAFPPKVSMHACTGAGR